MLNKKNQSLWRRIIALPGVGVFIALIVFIVAVSLISPLITGGRFLSLTNIINIFRQQTYIGIIACALTLVIITGNIDLSIGAQLTLMTVLCAKLSQTVGDLAIPLTLVAGLVCGLVNGLFVKGLQLNSFITTLGTGSIYGALALILATGHTVRGSYPVLDFIGTGNVFKIIPMPIIILLVVVVVFDFLARRTVFGQRLYAIGANPAAARFSGIKSRRDIGAAYALTGLCCALAAVVLLARSISANPQIGTGKEMDIILAVVLGGTSILGGKGSVLGTVIGFLFIGFTSSGFTFLAFSTHIQWIIMGVILLATLIIDVANERRGKL